MGKDDGQEVDNPLPSKISSTSDKGDMADMSRDNGCGASTKGKGRAGDENDRKSTSDSHLLSLPPELIDSILFLLSPLDLAAVSSTCRYLYKMATGDIFWRKLVQDNVPGVTVKDPYPCASFRELYIAHELRWFLPKYKIWFCNHELTGKLLVARYDPRTGNIEAYQLVAVSGPPTIYPWPDDEDILVQQFNPKVKLHLDRPIVRLPVHHRWSEGHDGHSGLSIARIPLHNEGNWYAGSIEDDEDAEGRDRESRDILPPPTANRFSAKMPMNVAGFQDTVYTNFLFARRIADPRLGGRTRFPFSEEPGAGLWPPWNIPARQRVSIHHRGRPASRAEVSDQAFHIDMGINYPVWDLNLQPLGDQLITYATLDPELYTPTERFPYRGIWVGDYSAHGCEFLLIHQEDNPNDDFDPDAIIKHDDETAEEFAKRKWEKTVYRGRLEAIKLTGDPNVPRGEHSFIADDLGEDGYVGVIDEEPFNGARVVSSRGHIAEHGFVRDNWLTAQLILISPNRIAQHWLEWGHFSFYERVDIDKFTGI